MKSSVQFSANKHIENISKLFKKLYDDEQLADVTLCCKDGTIKAHKLILAANSPYFHKIFRDHNRDQPILIMHGISYQNLHDLIELIYKGNVEVLPESLNPLYELASEFQLSGISGTLREEELNINHRRDTRFRGLKRVAVDYQEENNKRVVPRENEDLIVKNDEEVAIKKEILEPEEDDVQNTSEEVPKLSAWAKKQRKFKCDICPSSFKRASHLSRHQLVHTGERPFQCFHCDKAFSRHDKLKHHIRKSHDDEDFEVERYLKPERTTPPHLPPFVISDVRSEVPEESLSPNQKKRPRGRPRKYPIIPKPLIKRGRGRPRLFPERTGRLNGENYDITNLPFGDLNYLTMPLQESLVVEPDVNIVENSETIDTPEDSSEENLNKVNLKVLENRIAKIGECTISVADH